MNLGIAATNLVDSARCPRVVFYSLLLWFAIPSLFETFTLYSLSISRRTSVQFFTNRPVTPLCQCVSGGETDEPTSYLNFGSIRKLGS
jgi:hypothetical protein